MKKIILIATVALFTFACNQLSKNEYLVEGTANGIENGKKVFIQVQSENQTINRDTAVIENGKFEFKGKTESIELANLMIEDEKMPFAFILEEGKINLEIQVDSVFNSKTTGTFNNNKLQEYNSKSVEISKKRVKFEAANSERMVTARENKDTVTLNAIMKEHNSFQDELNLFSKEFISKNSKAYLSVLLVENFLMRQYLTTEEVQTYFSKLDKSLHTTPSGKNIANELKTLTSVGIGNKAPEFSAKNPEGKVISLKESLGKVTIIDFWASWCGPCRGENPNVVALYNEFHSKGLNIIGVSLDKDATKWAEAIKKDGLTWNQVSNLKYWQDPIATLYNVKSIPATFILDANGKIVAKDLRGAELKAKVQELLAL